MMLKFSACDFDYDKIKIKIVIFSSRLALSLSLSLTHFFQFLFFICQYFQDAVHRSTKFYISDAYKKSKKFYFFYKIYCTIFILLTLFKSRISFPSKTEYSINHGRCEILNKTKIEEFNR